MLRCKIFSLSTRSSAALSPTELRLIQPEYSPVRYFHGCSKHRLPDWFHSSNIHNHHYYYSLSYSTGVHAVPNISWKTSVLTKHYAISIQDAALNQKPPFRESLQTSSENSFWFLTSHHCSRFHPPCSSRNHSSFYFHAVRCQDPVVFFLFLKKKKKIEREMKIIYRFRGAGIL